MGGIDTVAHIVQVALTPVFLLSGIGTLLNVFNQRLARVSDHISHISALLDAGSSGELARWQERHLARLTRRPILNFGVNRVGLLA